MICSSRLIHSHAFWLVESGSERITGRDIFVRSYPTNLPRIVHMGTTSFGGLKNGSLSLERVPPWITVNAFDPIKFLKFTADYYIVFSDL